MMFSIRMHADVPAFLNVLQPHTPIDGLDSESGSMYETEIAHQLKLEILNERSCAEKEISTQKEENDGRQSTCKSTARQNLLTRMGTRTCMPLLTNRACTACLLVLVASVSVAVHITYICSHRCVHLLLTGNWVVSTSILSAASSTRNQPMMTNDSAQHQQTGEKTKHC
jgi:hypothetical protein